MTLNLMRSLILISLPFCCQSAMAPAIAQITPDNTLGAESSVVTPNVNINNIPSERIDGGAIRDTNLFHSFQELNVGEGRGAYFSNPSGIENILGRVTGINRSNILGTLGVLGNANLFLINPNGIMFGPNARLDLRGSFVGSTADSLMFGNGFDFSATNPQAPPLLTVNIPIGLRFREPAAQILVQGVGQNLGLNGATGSFDPAFGGLRVLPGETLTLASGNVLLDGGILEAPGGRVELGGLAAAGTLALNVDASLNFSDTVASGDVTLTNRSGINVIANSGGNIGINARNIDISGESLLTTGIASNQGFAGSQAGDIQLNATGEITLAASRIENNVNPGAIGNSGNINIIAASLVSLDGVQLDTTTLEGGMAGNIIIGNNTVALTNSLLRSDAFDQASGDGGIAGIIAIFGTNEVNIANSEITTDSVGEEPSGQAGGIGIRGGNILINSAALSIRAFGEGLPGVVLINANDTLAITNSTIFSDSRGSGDAGDILLQADSVIDIFNSSITSEVLGNQATGNAGGIRLTANSIFLTETAPSPDSPSLGTSNQGAGNAGNITIEAVDTVALDGGQIFSDTSNFSSGVAGAIEINASNEILIANQSTISSNGVFGRIYIGEFIDARLESSPPRTVMIDGSRVSTTESFGLGIAGDIIINAREQVAIVNQSNIIANGDMGQIFIAELLNSPSPAPTRIVIDTAVLTTRSDVEGNAGDIVIDARETVELTNSVIESNASGLALAGNVLINAPNQVSILGSSITSTSNNDNLSVFSQINILAPEGSVNLNQSEVSTTNSGSGFAGDIIINARDEVSIVNNPIDSNTGEPIAAISSDGNFGRIIIGKFIIQGMGQLSSPRRVTINNARLTTNNSAVDPERDVSILAGDVSITAIDSISITNGSSLEAFTSRRGNAGSITLNAETVSFDESNAFSTVEAGAVGDGGGIEIIADQLSLTNGAQLQALTRGEGNAGTVTIRARNTVSFDGVSNDENEFPSAAFSTVEEEAMGNGGGINITTDRLSITNGAVLTSSSEGNENNGTAGNINIVADTTRIRNGTISSNTVGGEGNINLRSRALILRRGSEISANASGAVNGGNITLDTGVLAGLENSDIRANAEQGFGGEVTIEAQDVFGTEFREETTDESDITATSELGREFFGIVELNTPDVDPSRGLVTLPVNVIDPASLIADNPCQEGEGSEFTVTGRGGLPSNPGESLRRDAVRVDLVEPAQSEAGEQGGTRGQGDKGTRGEKPLATSTAEKIVPAQGWVSNEKGEVVLTAYAPTSTTPQRPWQSPNPACPAP